MKTVNVTQESNVNYAVGKIQAQWDLCLEERKKKYEKHTVNRNLDSGEVEGHAGQAEPDFKLPKISFFKITEINLFFLEMILRNFFYC